VAEVATCKWDNATRTLTTRADERHEKAIKAFEGAAWFKDEFRMLKKGSKDSSRIPKEALFNLDGVASVKMIHDWLTSKERKYKGKIDLTNDTDGDSTSQTSSLSSDNDEPS
jgi:hypothetical protein